MSVGELAALSSMREVVVAEISPAVMQAAPLFDAGNLHASTSAKMRLVVSDAYRALLRSEGPFDVIMSEPSNPWVTGVEMLFSREFLAAARAQLAPGGVFAQWFHSYETDDATLALVLRTYASVFDRVAVWYTMANDLLLIGFREPDATVNLDRLIVRAAQPDFHAGLERSGVKSLPALLAHELLPIGVVEPPRAGEEVHTLLHPILSHHAARAFFRGGVARLEGVPPGAHADGQEPLLLDRLAAKSGGRLGDEQRTQAVREACRHRTIECARLLARWQLDDPSSPALAKQLERARQAYPDDVTFRPAGLALLQRTLPPQP